MGKQRTLVLIKPDSVKRKLIGEIIKRFEEGGLKISALKMAQADEEISGRHYPASDQQIVGMGNKTINAAGAEEAKRVFGTDDPEKLGHFLREFLIKFLTSGPLVAMVLEGEDAIAKVRAICGFTDCPGADKGTIRGDWGIDSIAKANTERRAIENLVHASGSEEEAEMEINIWFKPEDIIG